MSKCWELRQSRVGTTIGVDGFNGITRLFCVICDNATQDPISVARGEYLRGTNKTTGHKDTDAAVVAPVGSTHPWYRPCVCLRHRITEAPSPTTYMVEAEYGVPSLVEGAYGGAPTSMFWSFAASDAVMTEQLLRTVPEHQQANFTPEIIGPPEYRMRREGDPEESPHYVKIKGERVDLFPTGERISEPVMAERTLGNFTLTKIISRVDTSLLDTVWSYDRKVNASDFTVRLVGGSIRFVGPYHYKIGGIQARFVPADMLAQTIQQVGLEIALTILWSETRWTQEERVALFTDDQGNKGVVYNSLNQEVTYRQNTVPTKDFNDLFTVLK